MLELYYRPMACSLASRIALEEAALPAVYHPVNLETKRLADGGDFRTVSPKGQVPVLRTEEGGLLTESAAVLQYLADRRPEAGLAPPPGDPQRYELQAWLSFVSGELHKAFLFPTFTRGTPQAVRDHGRRLYESKLPLVRAHLADREHLLGERFSVADAKLLWALTLGRFAGVELGEVLEAYLARLGERPGVAKALATELAELESERAASEATQTAEAAR